jgi:hypothetical protein
MSYILLRVLHRRLKSFRVERKPLMFLWLNGKKREGRGCRLSFLKGELQLMLSFLFLLAYLHIILVLQIFLSNNLKDEDRSIFGLIHNNANIKPMYKRYKKCSRAIQINKNLYQPSNSSIIDPQKI